MPTVRLSEVTAARIRSLREQAQATQQGIADLMSEKGFPWRRETVAQSEAEGRTVSVAELLALCSIFGQPLQTFIVPPPATAPSGIPVEVFVTVNQKMRVERRELIRLIEAGAPIPTSRNDRQRQQLIADIALINLKLSKTDEQMKDIEEVRERLTANLRRREEKLRLLEVENGKC